MSNFEIRHGKPEDAALLAELGARTFSQTFHADNSPENMAAYLAAAFSPAQQHAELTDPRATVFIAETVDQTGKPNHPNSRVAVGYAMIRSGEVPAEVTGAKPIELVRLYVSQELIGTGVGAALMKSCIDEVGKLGYESLWLGVWEKNPQAQMFYRKWDFREVGTHVFQLGDDPQTDILMQRLISK